MDRMPCFRTWGRLPARLGDQAQRGGEVKEEDEAACVGRGGCTYKDPGV